ncbi:hypothetical protein [Leucobacter chromiireducens]|nr:hypothetical protein [Leucobacter chromiireducens]
MTSGLPYSGGVPNGLPRRAAWYPDPASLRTTGARDRARRIHDAMWRLHPVLIDILKGLRRTRLALQLHDRVEQLVTAILEGGLVDRAGALAPHRRLLSLAEGEGLPLTAAGNLKPVTVKELAPVLPTIEEWPFGVGTELNTDPVHRFRVYVVQLKLLRQYRGHLQLTRVGRIAHAHPVFLWQYLAKTLALTSTRYHAEASIVTLIHMGTSEGEVDIDAVIRTLAALGWTVQNGAPITEQHLSGVVNDHWTALGNIRPEAHDPNTPLPSPLRNRPASKVAKLLVADALLHRVVPRTR